MNTWRKVGCCLVAAVAAFGSMSVSAKGIEGIFGTAESSGDHSVGPARNAFLSSYWLAGDSFKTYSECFIQANLQEAYTPREYTLDCTTSNGRNRNPQGFRLYGCTGTDADGKDVWTLLDERICFPWPNDKTKCVHTFCVGNPQACTKLKFVITRICQDDGGDKPCISRLTFEDELPGLPAECDLVSTARLLGGETMTVASSSGLLGGSAANVFDGNVTMALPTEKVTEGDNPQMTRPDNGLWYGAAGPGSGVTLSFDTEAFGGRVPLLTGYQMFRYPGSNSPYDKQLARYLNPASWKVYGSVAEQPTEADWFLIDEMSSEDVTTKEALTFAAHDVEKATAQKYDVFNVKLYRVSPVRHVKIEVVTAGNPPQTDETMLGEIRLFGRIPSATGSGDCGVGEAAVASTSVQDATLDVLVLPQSASPEPYDLFADLTHDGKETTVLLAKSVTTVGMRTYALERLKTDTDYTVQVHLVNASGTVSQGEVLEFATDPEPELVILPAGFKRIEYVESTENGKQLVDLGFKPTGRFGLEADCYIYSPLKSNASAPADGTLNRYGGIYGAGAFALTTSTASQGQYETGFRIEGGKYFDALLTISNRIQIAHHGQSYFVTCGDSVTPNGGLNERADCAYNLYAFGCASDSAPNGGEWGIVRFYSIAYFNEAVSGGPMTHQFSPAEAADGKRGFYDLLDENPETAWHPSTSENGVELVAGPVLPCGRLAGTTVNSYSGTRLNVTLTRTTDANDETVYAAWGPDYCGIIPSAWAHQATMKQSFEAGNTSVTVTLKGLTENDVYVYFYTSDGRLSETIYLPDLERQRSGMVLLLK